MLQGKFENIKLNPKYIFVIICTVIAIGFVSLFTPLFGVSEIVVEGNAIVSPETVIKASGIEYGNNFFEVNPVLSQEKISKVAYVDSVKVKRVFPGKIKIIISESSESVYMSFAGNYIGIDNKGKILEIKQQSGELTKPVVYGIDISNFTIGNYADIPDGEKKKLLFEMISECEEKNLSDKIYSMDISDTNNIFFVLRNNITVKIGKNENIKYKIAYLYTVLQEIPEETGGVLDISNTENVIYSN